MMKTICSLFIALLFSSCDLVTAINYQTGIKNVFGNSSDVRPVSISFNTMDDAWFWVWENIKYNPTPSVWQAPQETIDKLSGDCIDSSILLAQFLTNEGITDIKIVACKAALLYDAGFLSGDRNGNHCVLKVSGKYLEAQSYNQYYDSSLIDVIEEFTLERALTVSAINGSKKIISK